MTLSSTDKIGNKSIEGLLDFFDWEDREKIKELYRDNRVFTKLNKMNFTSSPKVLTILDFQYHWVNFCKKSNKNSILVEFFILLDKEKIPKNLEFKLINNNKLQEQILASLKHILNNRLLTFDINSQWETFIDYQTQYSFLNIPELKPFEEILFYSDIFGGLLNLIKANGDRLEYKKESDKIVRFRIVEEFLIF